MNPKRKTVWVTTKKPRFADIEAQIKKIGGGNIQVLKLDDIKNPARICGHARGWVLLVTYGHLNNDEDREHLERWMEHDFSGCVSKKIPLVGFFLCKTVASIGTLLCFRSYFSRMQCTQWERRIQGPS